MNQATAATVIKDLVLAGYLVQLFRDDAVCRVFAWSANGAPVDVSLVATFATNHGVAGMTSSVEFI